MKYLEQTSSEVMYLTLIYPPNFKDFQCWKYQSGVDHIFMKFKIIVNRGLSFIQRQTETQIHILYRNYAHNH